MINIKHLKAVYLLIISIFLTACGDPMYAEHGDAMWGTALGAAGGAIVGGVSNVGAGRVALVGAAAGLTIGAYLDSKKTLVQKLEAQDIQVVIIGDEVTLLLPTDKFFVNNTPQLNCRTTGSLCYVIQFINCLEKIEVKITGYTDNCQACLRDNVAISKAMADNLANYLWSHGLDARVLYTNGCGCCDPIATNTTTGGRAKNRRIEITLRKLPRL